LFPPRDFNPFSDVSSTVVKTFAAPMVIIHRAFYREATGVSLAITLVLLAVFIFITLTILLGRAAAGENADAVLHLLGYQVLRRLDLLLPLALYLGILLTLSRWYRDSEMTVLAACGVGLPQMMRPVLILALIFATAVGAAALYLSPLANRQIEKIKDQSTRRPAVTGIAPGVFTEFPGRGLIVYTQRIEPDTGALERVFISRFQDRNKGVVSAKSGLPVTDPKTGDKFLVLRDGVLYQGAPGRTDYRILEFETYSVLLAPKKLNEPDLGIDSISTPELWSRSDRYANSEWHWRLSKPIITFVLAAFAVAFAFTDARRGRMSNLFVAILVYFIYSNVLALGQTFLKRGQVPDPLGLWWVHLLFAAFATYLLVRRIQNRPLWRLPRLVGMHR
jgi:lipopolysaccharide export system permease protein